MFSALVLERLSVLQIQVRIPLSKENRHPEAFQWSEREIASGEPFLLLLLASQDDGSSVIYFSKNRTLRPKESILRYIRYNEHVEECLLKPCLVIPFKIKSAVPTSFYVAERHLPTDTCTLHCQAVVDLYFSCIYEPKKISFGSLTFPNALYESGMRIKNLFCINCSSPLLFRASSPSWASLKARNEQDDDLKVVHLPSKSCFELIESWSCHENEFSQKFKGLQLASTLCPSGNSNVAEHDGCKAQRGPGDDNLIDAFMQESSSISILPNTKQIFVGTCSAIVCRSQSFCSKELINNSHDVRCPDCSCFLGRLLGQGHINLDLYAISTTPLVAPESNGAMIDVKIVENFYESILARQIVTCIEYDAISRFSVKPSLPACHKEHLSDASMPDEPILHMWVLNFNVLYLQDGETPPKNVLLCKRLQDVTNADDMKVIEVPMKVYKSILNSIITRTFDIYFILFE